MSDKLLAEYCGLCWHNFVEGTGDYDHCEHCRIAEWQATNPDFSTPNGYELLHKAISKKRDWDSLYLWYKNKSNWKRVYMAGCGFHERNCAEKSQITSEWLEETQ